MYIRIYIPTYTNTRTHTHIHIIKAQMKKLSHVLHSIAFNSSALRDFW